VLRLGRAVACAALVSIVAGCGSDTRQSTSTPPADDDQIRATLRSLAEATNAGDVSRLCEDVYAFQHSTTTKQCTEVLERALARSRSRVTIKPITVRRARSRATVVAMTTGLGSHAGSQRQTYSLVREHGAWRVLFE
jgi:ketosteroid isomerase-like protein